ncbi:MAG: metal ABC transporter ATP-binding protein [Thermodesulfobacterium sp.]|nr:metal ABC transporter ATP-binding protein [Thermodesulfobacterium sp.]
MRRIVEVKGLNLSFNGVKILEDIDLTIEKGDFLAIIGPNGGGKTTLLKCILGFLKPQTGEIKLFGKPIESFRAWEKIGYVPQRSKDYHIKLNPLTVEEFIALPSKLYGVKLNKDKLAKLVKVFGLEDLLTKRLADLSFGQVQRAQIVQALALEPEVLFLDEPTVGLDFMRQKNFYELLTEFNRQGLTIVVITHETWLLHSGISKVACLNRRLYYHGVHEEFCQLAGLAKEGTFPDFHLIGHEHW